MGMHVIIPKCLKTFILRDLHQDHPGNSRMKLLAHSYLWWPGRLGPWRVGQVLHCLLDCQTSTSCWSSSPMDVKPTTATSTMALRHLFAVYRLPEHVVLVHRSSLKTLWSFNGVKQSRCSPYHLSSNGDVECLVCSFKQAMKAGKHNRLSIGHQLKNFLMTYRTTPHATTRVPPSALSGREIIHHSFEQQCIHTTSHSRWPL